MEKPYTLKFTRRNLPHWLVADHSYFVTLRLKGTLPKAVIEQFRQARKQLAESGSDESRTADLARKQFVSIEKILDSVSAAQWLGSPEVATIVWDNLDWLRGRGWLVYAAVLMPNHIHLLMRNEDGRTQELLDDLAQFKCYTARKANEALKRTGAFWAREDFDHWIRNREKFEGTVRYIANNPVKAGLAAHWSEWKWCVADESAQHCLPAQGASP